MSRATCVDARTSGRGILVIEHHQDDPPSRKLSTPCRGRAVAQIQTLSMGEVWGIGRSGQRWLQSLSDPTPRSGPLRPRVAQYAGCGSPRPGICLDRAASGDTDRWGGNPSAYELGGLLPLGSDDRDAEWNIGLRKRVGLLVSGSTVQAVRFDRYGEVDVLNLVEVPRPRPGPGRVVVQVVAAAINPG
jgi:hypothetical protein